MKSEGSFQILDEVKKYADYELNFFKFLCKYLSSIEKSETA